MTNSTDVRSDCGVENRTIRTPSGVVCRVRMLTCGGFGRPAGTSFGHASSRTAAGVGHGEAVGVGRGRAGAAAGVDAPAQAVANAATTAAIATPLRESDTHPLSPMARSDS